MGTKRAKILIAIVFAIVGAVIARLIANSFAAMAVAAMGGLVAGTWVADRLADQKPPALGKRLPLALPELEDDSAAAPEEAELRDLLNKLADANLAARLAGFDAGMLAPLEALIDDLRPAVEAMMARHPGDRLTWELARLCDRHVPRVVKEFADLSRQAREVRRADMLETLNILADQVRRTAALVARDEADEFQAAANVIATKFGTSVS